MDAKRGAAEPSTCALALALATWSARARWLLGTGLSILGWPLQVRGAAARAARGRAAGARRRACSCCCSSRERMLGEHAGRNEHLAMRAIVIGVVGAGLCGAAARRPRTRLRAPDDHARARRARPARACCPTCCALLGRSSPRRDDGRRRPRRSAGAASRRSSPSDDLAQRARRDGRRVGRCPRRPPRASACSAR